LSPVEDIIDGLLQSNCQPLPLCCLILQCLEMQTLFPSLSCNEGWQDDPDLENET
jgi:hypothetical protein